MCSTSKCCWIYVAKFGSDGQLDRLKAHLVAKGYTHIFRLDQLNKDFSLYSRSTRHDYKLVY